MNQNWSLYPDVAGQYRTTWPIGQQRSETADVAIVSPQNNQVFDFNNLDWFLPGPTSGSKVLLVNGTATGASSVECNGVRVAVEQGQWHGYIPVSERGALHITAQSAESRHVIKVHCATIKVVAPEQFSVVGINPADPPSVPAIPVRAELLGIHTHLRLAARFRWTLVVGGRYCIRKPTTNRTYGPARWVEYQQPAIVTDSSVPQMDIVRPDVVGGWGRITAEAILPNERGDSTNRLISDVVWIDIQGRNPSKSAVQSKVQQIAGANERELLLKLICHESSFRQFDSRPNKNEPIDSRVPRRLGRSAYRPLWNAPAGIGLGQLDPASEFPSQHWNWVANLEGMVTVLRNKVEEAEGWRKSEERRLERQRLCAEKVVNENRAHHSPPLPAISLPTLSVPHQSADQFRCEIIRHYNGFNQHRFDAFYELTQDKLAATLAGSRSRIEDPGVWETTNSPRTFKWKRISTNSGYVNAVENCQT